MIFHLFLHEILIWKIKGCSPQGMHISLGFFCHVLITPETMQQPTKFDEAAELYVWE
jgi:DNA-directed RNA polymerase III subunit RPC8